MGLTLVSRLTVVSGWVLTEVPPPTSDVFGAVGGGLRAGSVLLGVFESVGFFTPTPPPEGWGEEKLNAVDDVKLIGPDLKTADEEAPDPEPG